MAVLASLSFFMMTILTIKTGNRLAGYLFLTLTYNHYFLLHLRRAMTESSLLFFSTIFVFVLYMMLSSINNNTSTKLFYWASALGIVVGLAGQSKLNGLACGIAAFVALVLKLLHMPKLSMKRRFSIFFTTMTLSFFTTIVSFIGSYPFLYEEPFRRTGATFLVRYTVMQSQSENTYDTISAHERPGILLNQIFRHPLSIAESNWGYATSLLLLIITLYGIACFTSKVFSKNNQIDLYISIYATSLILAIPPLFTPLNWDRYYLYPVIFSLFYMTTGTSRWVSKCLKVPVTRLL